MKPFVEASAPWQRGGVAVVCEKCCTRRYADDFPERAGDPRLDLRSYLKERLKREGRWGPIRVVSGSCLDVCARGGVTVLIDPIGDPPRASRCVVVDPLEGGDELYAAIVATLAPASTPE